MTTLIEKLEAELAQLKELRIEFAQMSEIHVKTFQDVVWVFDPKGQRKECNRISSFIDEEEGEKWFLFYVEDCYQPAIDLVRADSWEEAYEDYVDFAVNHRGIKIEESDYADYKINVKDDKGNYLNDATCGFTSNGTPVDTEAIQGREASLHKIVV